MAIESLAQQASTFVDALTVSPASGKEAEEADQEVRTPEQGDTVAISEEARAIVAMEMGGETQETEEDSSDTDDTISNLEDQIAALEEEIKEIQDDDELSDEEKLSQLQDKQAQLMQLQQQLLQAQQEALEAEGLSATGGTRANGFGDSVGDF